ncbi:hypothetical protein GF340_00650 [Candidatus Peregrinibacteria bacterium]|nr:hypothetical protein [Candidatus Peregrinibacteria bacterium]
MREKRLIFQHSPETKPTNERPRQQTEANDAKEKLTPNEIIEQTEKLYNDLSSLRQNILTEIDRRSAILSNSPKHKTIENRENIKQLKSKFNKVSKSIVEVLGLTYKIDENKDRADHNKLSIVKSSLKIIRNRHANDINNYTKNRTMQMKVKDKNKYIDQILGLNEISKADKKSGAAPPEKESKKIPQELLDRMAF